MGTIIWRSYWRWSLDSLDLDYNSIMPLVPTMPHIPGISLHIIDADGKRLGESSIYDSSAYVQSLKDASFRVSLQSKHPIY